ncbi:hypothetical protein Pcinc_004842 [Petrolisthes cinctipes]|uniref:m7GpppN-mRNA hydrolase NUDT17 n=1 Tax=Petrolisthes cinctipes TaxID=88211 RepID=A0AAE1GER2_PETCI|nr:hypothetical protein Pcinc_004842 [Petrolisthes cinctipes]
MAASTYKRTVVYVRKDPNSPYHPAPFDTCLLDYFGISDDLGSVECRIRNNIVYLQPPFVAPPATTSGGHVEEGGGSSGSESSREKSWRNERSESNEKKSLRNEGRESNEKKSWRNEGRESRRGESLRNEGRESRRRESLRRNTGGTDNSERGERNTIDGSSSKDNRERNTEGESSSNEGNRKCDNKRASRFQHPPFCVGHKITEEQKDSLPLAIRERGVDVGVCILVESSDGRILVTRRAPHMRTFPRVWVPPGGHVEEGENLVEAGVREMMEETGLELNSLMKMRKQKSVQKKEEEEEEEEEDKRIKMEEEEESREQKKKKAEEEGREVKMGEKDDMLTGQEVKDKCRILGLWESYYPPVLYCGLPKRHHLVVYFHLKLKLSSTDLQQFIKLNYSEVDACVWLTRELAEVIVNGYRYSTLHLYTPCPSLDLLQVPITLVDDEGFHIPALLDPKALRKEMPEPDREVERVSTGTRYALQLWLQNLAAKDKKKYRNAKNTPMSINTRGQDRSQTIETPHRIGQVRRGQLTGHLRRGVTNGRLSVGGRVRGGHHHQLRTGQVAGRPTRKEEEVRLQNNANSSVQIPVDSQQDTNFIFS